MQRGTQARGAWLRAGRAPCSVNMRQSSPESRHCASHCAVYHWPEVRGRSESVLYFCGDLRCFCVPTQLGCAGLHAHCRERRRQGETRGRCEGDEDGGRRKPKGGQVMERCNPNSSPDCGGLRRSGPPTKRSSGGERYPCHWRHTSYACIRLMLNAAAPELRRTSVSP